MSFTAGSTVGKYNFTLTKSEIGHRDYGALLNQNGNQIGVHGHDDSIAKSFDILQPSIVVYIWKRTS